LTRGDAAEEARLIERMAGSHSSPR
jgi:hypothetical protein